LTVVGSWIGRATAQAVVRRVQSPTSHLHQEVGRVVYGLSKDLRRLLETGGQSSKEPAALNLASHEEKQITSDI
jgi:hypothetical protein